MVELEKLLDVMVALRSPSGGCPWDQEQTFESVVPYTIEEAYEVADAIDRGNADDIRDELGDLLFQIVFYAEMARENGWFDFADVASAITDKLVRRHPHVFANDTASAGAAAQKLRWEDIKAGERAASDGGCASALEDIPRSLPALAGAQKLGSRAARVGFDWPTAAGARAKIDEELVELDAEIGADAAGVAAECGDLLFSVVNLCRHLGVNAEEQLRLANRKFERRFRGVEAAAVAEAGALSAVPAERMNDLWEQQKSAEIED